MDIAPDGTVSVRQGAGAANWEVVTAPLPTRPSTRTARRSSPPAPTPTSARRRCPPQYAAAAEPGCRGGQHQPDLAVGPGLAGKPLERRRRSPRRAPSGLAQLMPGDRPLSRRQSGRPGREPHRRRAISAPTARSVRRRRRKGARRLQCRPGPRAQRRRRPRHRRDPELCGVDRAPHLRQFHRRKPMTITRGLAALPCSLLSAPRRGRAGRSARFGPDRQRADVAAGHACSAMSPPRSR